MSRSLSLLATLPLCILSSSAFQVEVQELVVLVELEPVLFVLIHERSCLLPVPLRDQDHQVVGLDIFHLEFAEVEQVGEEVALREGQVLVTQVIEVRMHEGIDRADSLLWLID